MRINFFYSPYWYLVPTIQICVDTSVYYYKSVNFLFLNLGVEISWGYLKLNDFEDEYYDDIV